MGACVCVCVPVWYLRAGMWDYCCAWLCVGLWVCLQQRLEWWAWLGFRLRVQLGMFQSRAQWKKSHRFHRHHCFWGYRWLCHVQTVDWYTWYHAVKGLFKFWVGLGLGFMWNGRLQLHIKNARVFNPGQEGRWWKPGGWGQWHWPQHSSNLLFSEHKSGYAGRSICLVDVKVIAAQVVASQWFGSDTGIFAQQMLYL